MSRSANIQVRINAIAKELQNGISRDVIVSKYCKKFQLSARQIDNYIEKANQKAREAQIAKEAAEADALYEHAKEAEKRRLLDKLEAQEILTKIALGEYELEKVFLMKDGLKKIKAKPDHSDVLKAIDSYKKMEGWDAPSKVAQTDSKGEDVPVINFIPASSLTKDQIEKLTNG